MRNGYRHFIPRPLGLRREQTALLQARPLPYAETLERRFLLSADPTTGLALVYPPEGPINFALTTDYSHPVYSPLEQVTLSDLGQYDSAGNLTGSNNGLLNGRYIQTSVVAINDSTSGIAPFGPLESVNNDFRVNPNGDSNGSPREALLWNSQAALYYYITDYRDRFLNNSFIDELQLPTQIAENLKNLQYRPDGLVDGVPTAQHAPVMTAVEDAAVNGSSFDPFAGTINVGVRSPLFSSGPAQSLAWDAGTDIGEYVGLLAFSVMGSNLGFPPFTFFGEDNSWQVNASPAINDGLSFWEAYVYTGNPVYGRYFDGIERDWGGRLTFDQQHGIDQWGGQGDVRNVMMLDQNNASLLGNISPYSQPTGFNSLDGPNQSDLAGQYVAGIFYDLANDAGIGVHNADLLFWKSLSLVSEDISQPNASGISMAQFGLKIQQAARDLFPDVRPGHLYQSVYEQDIDDVLMSRGIALNGASDFRQNLPPPLGSAGSLDESSQNGFGSQHPEISPGVDAYGQYAFATNGYHQSDTSAQYVSYQFYRLSKYGPADRLAVTDGSFTVTASTWAYNHDGSFYVELTDRTLGNLVLLAPGRVIHWVRVVGRAINEGQGFYPEDVAPFGFSVIKSTSNGFSFHVTDLGVSGNRHQYACDIVDPSNSFLGSATYNWAVTDYLGNALTLAGQHVQFSVPADQPFGLHIDRIRGGATDSIDLRESADAFGREGGNAFVLNEVAPGTVPLPMSTVAPLLSTESSSDFEVSWSGSVAPGAPQISNYSVYVSDDGGPYTPWAQQTTSTQATFTGAVGHTYRFYSLATDSAGNVQAIPGSAQAVTTVGASSSSALHLVFLQQPSNSTANQSVTPPVTVAVEDAAGDLVTSDQSSVALSVGSGPAGGTLGGTLIEPVQNGIATFANFSINMPGVYALEASDGSDAAILSGSFSVSTSSATLFPTLTRTTLPAAVIGGTPLRRSAFVNLTNNGSATASGWITVNLFASPGAMIEASDIPVATVKRQVVLKPGRTLMLIVPIRSLPGTLPAGTYALLAQAVDASGNSADAASGPSIEVTPPFVSLSATIGPVQPPRLRAGRSGLIMLPIENQGNVAAAGLLTVTLSPSADGAAPLGGITLGRASLRASVGPSRRISVKLRVLVPLGLAPGRYFIIASASLAGELISVVGAAMLSVS